MKISLFPGYDMLYTHYYCFIMFMYKNIMTVLRTSNKELKIYNKHLYLLPPFFLCGCMCVFLCKRISNCKRANKSKYNLSRISAKNIYLRTLRKCKHAFKFFIIMAVVFCELRILSLVHFELNCINLCFLYFCLLCFFTLKII